jgi:hypothetical protein
LVIQSLKLREKNCFSGLAQTVLRSRAVEGQLRDVNNKTTTAIPPSRQPVSDFDVDLDKAIDRISGFA